MGLKPTVIAMTCPRSRTVLKLEPPPVPLLRPPFTNTPTTILCSLHLYSPPPCPTLTAISAVGIPVSRAFSRAF